MITTAPSTARFTDQARNQLVDGLRVADSREIGGWLYGVADGASFEIRYCSIDAHVERAGDRIKLDSVRALELGKEREALYGESLLGDWHSHGRGPISPSDDDRLSWGALSNLVESRTFLGLIVGGAPIRPEESAWVTYRDSEERINCRSVEVLGVPLRSRRNAMDDGTIAEALDADSVLEVLEAMTGISGEEATLIAQQRRRTATERAKDQVREAEGLALAIKRARRKATVLYGEWRRSGMRIGGLFEEHLEATRAAKQLDAELRELLCEDEALISQVKAWAGL
jgi:hypothetical protein